MSRSGGAPAVAGVVLAFALGAGLAFVAAAPLAAQAGLDKGAAKRELSDLDVAVARLQDGWRHATLAVGADAEPEVVAEAIVRMIHDPIKLVGFGTSGALEREENLALKAALLRAEERVLAAPALGEAGGEAAVRAATQHALDEYLAVLGPWLAARPKPATGALRP
jgi:hypothetical protein